MQNIKWEYFMCGPKLIDKTTDALPKKKKNSKNFQIIFFLFAFSGKSLFTDKNLGFLPLPESHI